MAGANREAPGDFVRTRHLIRTLNLKSPAPNSIRYLQAYGSVFEGPHWLPNLLFGTLCQFIPVVGPLVYSGYCYELIELNSKQPGVPNPPFEFRRFVDYLVRGVWPFVIQLISQFLLQPPLMVLYFVTLMPPLLMMPRLGPNTGVLVLFLGIGAYILIVLVLAVALSLVLTPLLLRAGLAQDLGMAIDFKWVIDFNRRVWFDLVLIILFLICTAVPLALLGYAMCFVGMFPMISVIQLAGVNLSWQLYNLYLTRGGVPIPLKPSPPGARIAPAGSENASPFAPALPAEPQLPPSSLDAQRPAEGGPPTLAGESI